MSDFKAAIRWCLLFMADDKGALRSADGKKLRPPPDIQEAFDAAYAEKCKVCDGLGYSVGVSKRIQCETCDGSGHVLIE